MTNLQKKTEERFKEKVKQIKVFNAFFTNIFKDKAEAMYDKETKTLLYTAETLQQIHQELYMDVKQIPKLPPIP
jgi:hypothetical protein